MDGWGLTAFQARK